MKKYNSYKRICSICKKELTYSCPQNFYRAKKQNGLCLQCNLKNNSFAKGIRSEETKQKMRDKKIGKERPEWVRKKLSESKKGISTATEKSRELLRNHRLKQIKQLKSITNYNPKACNFIDKINKQMGINLQHALNGGEILISGYLLDGYDKERNIVFEYDEPHHHQLNKKYKDLIRQNRIIENIKPKRFLRYDEKNDVLYEVI